MENDFKGRIIYSENYQSTIDSIKLINKSPNAETKTVKNVKNITLTMKLRS